ncbi:hypothetical protein GCM10023178_77920 [Actinomadura luteofluorescens]
MRDGLTGHDAPDGDLAGVGAAFRGLPESDRELLALVGWEGLDHGEIATVLGCSRNAVRIRLHRARRRFARALARADADAPAASTPLPATPLPTTPLPAAGRRIPNGDPT